MIRQPLDDWQRVERLLDEVLDLPSEDRSAFLERACDGDTALRQRVESLLRAAEAADQFLERPAHDYAARLMEEMVDAAEADNAAPSPPFERVGHYRLIREVGRGGMGAVYLAERDDDERLGHQAWRAMQSG